ncbi:MAG TPA: asparaginase [Candidatus Competibacteraceae bacterium]|nr:asparaginase [Candidatus Competibacteraceae bacterium]
MTHDILPAHAPLAVATRGDTVESVHYGSIAVVDTAGELLHAVGDPQALTFCRSACKPFQAVPLVAAGGLERFALSEAETALLCASHSGEPCHVQAAFSILHKAGCREDQLQCGSHPPLGYEVSGRRPYPGEVFTPIQHNCSGKHAGMLAACRLFGAPIDSYLDFEHPLQLAIRRAVAHYCGVAEAQLRLGVDGCSAPNFAAPLRNLARAFARLAEARDDPEYGAAHRRLYAAMVRHPEMVSGTGRSDLAIMQAGGGDWVAKIGAEAVQCIGIRSRGLGIAIKISDGASRALYPVIVELLRQLGLLATDVARRLLAPYARPPLKNWRGTQVGEIRPVFRLE